jgi:hypothetical protein
MRMHSPSSLTLKESLFPGQAPTYTAQQAQQVKTRAAGMKRDSQLFVYWTRVGDMPECILRSTIDLS